MRPEEGWLEWDREEEEPHRYFGFRIVHHALASPLRVQREEKEAVMTCADSPATTCNTTLARPGRSRGIKLGIQA